MQSMNLRVGRSESFQGGRRNPRRASVAAPCVPRPQLRMDVERWAICVGNPLPAAPESNVDTNLAREVVSKVVTHAMIKLLRTSKRQPVHASRSVGRPCVAQAQNAILACRSIGFMQFPRLHVDGLTVPWHGQLLLGLYPST